MRTPTTRHILVLAFLAGCTTTSANLASGDAVSNSVKGYRACTVKAMAGYLKSGGKGDAKRAVDRNCSMHLDRFAEALKQAGVKPEQANRYRTRLRSATIKYSSAAIVALMYKEYRKNGRKPQPRRES